MVEQIASARQLVRSLWRTPAYTLTTVLVLGCGIGAGVAALAIAQRALLEPLPYDHADRLAVILEATPGGARRLASYPTVEDWAAQAAAFQSFSYVTGSQLLLRGQPDAPVQLTVAYPSGDFFQLMSARPLLGRVLSPADESARSVVVLSHRAWRRQFGGRRDIVGLHVPLGDGGATVIGVMPPGFAFPEWAQAWMPLSAAPASIQRMLRQRANHADSRVIARLRDGVSSAQATAQLNVVATRLAQAYPEDSREWSRVSLVSMPEYTLSFTAAGADQNLRPRLALFAGAAALILLLGCANVAVLGLVRGLARSRELAIRAALGAGRWRIVRNSMSEALIIAAAGGVVGLWLGYTIVRVVQRWNPDLFPRLAEVQLDRTFVFIAIALSITAALASGLLPAIRATPDSLTAIFGGTRGRFGDGRATSRLQRALISGQVAIAVLLAVGAGLLIESLKRVIDTPVGFDVHHLSVATVTPPPGKYDSPERTLLLYRSLIDAVGRVPGVQLVAFANHAPLGNAAMPTRVVVPGREAPPNQPDLANFKTISPNYFSATGISLLHGRTFTDADLSGPNGSVVINHRLAARFWPNEDPIGKSLTIFKSARWLPDFGEPLRVSVIGVVADVRHFGQESDPPEEVYVPYTWNLWQWGSLVIRSAGDPALVRAEVRKAMLAVEPDLPMGGGDGNDGYASFGERLTALQTPRRMLTGGLGLLAVAAVGITMLGLYATLAFSVGRRRAELGLRFALGAQRGRVLAGVLREGLAVVGIGLAVGLTVAWLGVTVLQSLIFGVSPRNVATFAIASVPLVLAALLAAWLPARNATMVAPAEALRGD